MKKRSALFCLSSGLMAALSCVLFNGCGKSEPESNADFIKSLHEQGGPVGETDGTMPPIGESMDQVAKIRFETTDLHLGLIRHDEIHHHKLKVYNDGKMPLKITKIDTTCACTMGYITPENATVMPGRESWIDVTLDPNRVPGFSSHKVLTVTSTDPAHPQVEIDVYSEIEPEYFLEFEELELGEFPKGDTVERHVRFRQIQDIPANVTGVEVLTLGPTAPKIPGVTARVDAVPEAEWVAPGKREFDIVITIGPEISTGAFERNVVLLTDVKRLPKHRIHVTGTSMAPYTPAPVYPERITLGPDATGDQSARATFTSTGPLALAIEETSNPVLSAVVTPGPTPNEMYVDVRVPAAAIPHKLFDETVKVQVTAEGKTFTEIVGVRNAGNADASGEGHDH